MPERLQRERDSALEGRVAKWVLRADIASFKANFGKPGEAMTAGPAIMAARNIIRLVREHDAALSSPRVKAAVELARVAIEYRKETHALTTDEYGRNSGIIVCAPEFDRLEAAYRAACEVGK